MLISWQPTPPPKPAPAKGEGIYWYFCKYINGLFYDFVFRPDGKMLATTGYGMMFLDPETGRQIKRQMQDPAPEQGSV